MLASTLLRAATVVAAALLVALPASAVGAPSKTRAIDAAPWVTDGFGSSSAARLTGRSSFSGQHGPSSQHLPAVRENIELVGKLEMDTPNVYKEGEFQADVLEGQIADLAVYKSTAYLNSWSEPSCERGGFFSVDISNPAKPRQLAFAPAREDTYHGEGAHAITLDTPAFKGDLLAVNNEPCTVGQIDDTQGVGGFELYDVTNPARPTRLTNGPLPAGDQSPDTGGGRGSTTQNPAEIPNSNHSIFAWQDGPRAYAVIVDNTELHDVDIFDITNPRAPTFVADIDLFALADEQCPVPPDSNCIVDNSANGDAIFHHDMVVKKIRNVPTMLVSYWDAGYIKLDVSDPANPRIIGDSDFGTTDPLTGLAPPEGNGHQAEFSHDNKFVLAADEDFSTYRTDFSITTGPNAGRYPSGEFGFSIPIATLPDKKLDGPVVYGGYGCNANNQIPAADTAIPPGSLEAGEEQIVVIQRGPVNDPAHPYPGCRFDEKMQNAIDKGYEGIIIANHHAGSDNGNSPDAALCGSGEPRDIRGMCIGHRAFHLLFNDTPDYDPDYTPNSEPAVGTIGQKVAATATFDGWGYTHLYRNTGTDLEAVDHFAIEESLDERYASGFGDLSVHEFATDPDVNVAYSSYYAGGMRVFTFGDDGLTQTGKFIDDGGEFGESGNNFWGVEVFTTPQGDRLFAGSDRDFGLYVFRYTGPGKYEKPAGGGGGGAGGGAPAAKPLKSTGCENQILGTAARDLIAGTEGSDTIRAAAGDDVVDARSGDDCLFGDEGKDVIDGEGGNDRLEGATGDDRLIGSVGNDALIGGGGVDRLNGNAGDDRLGGGSKRDILAGGSGRDALFGGAGNDAISGGAGNDRISGGSAADRIYGNAGADRITPGRGSDRVIAAGGNDRISARDGKKDRISCGSGRDRVTADRKDVLTNCERVSRR